MWSVLPAMAVRRTLAFKLYLERRKEMKISFYVCYENEGYMNTGIQRSSTTPRGATTSTTRLVLPEEVKQLPPKNVPLIMAMHHIPYVATATLSNMDDFVRKLLKAVEKKQEGFVYLHVFTPCPVRLGNRERYVYRGVPDGGKN